MIRKASFLGIACSVAFVVGIIAYWPREGATIILASTDSLLPSYSEGDTAIVTVNARNPHSVPFVVESVSSSCGCTRPMLGAEPLAPGAVFPADSNTALSVKIDTTGLAGNVRHSIRLVGFFGQASSKLVACEASVAIKVIAGARIVPSEVTLVGAMPGKPMCADILVLDGGAGDAERVEVVRVSNPESMEGHFRSVPPDLEDANGGHDGFLPRRLYRLEYVPSNDPHDEHEFVDFLIPGSAEAKAFRVGVLCLKEPVGFTFSPASLSVSPATGEDAVVREVLCITEESASVSLTVVAKPPDVDVSARHVGVGRYVVRISIPATRLSKPGGFEIKFAEGTEQQESIAYRVSVHGSSL